VTYSHAESITVDGLECNLRIYQSDNRSVEDYACKTKSKKACYEVVIGKDRSGSYVVDARQMVSDFRETGMSGWEAHVATLNHINYLKALYNGNITEYIMQAEFIDPLHNEFISDDSEFFEYGHYYCLDAEGFGRTGEVTYNENNAIALCKDAIGKAIRDAIDNRAWHLCHWFRAKMGNRKFLGYL
jgi:hypothetical protein